MGALRDGAVHLFVCLFVCLSLETRTFRAFAFARLVQQRNSAGGRERPHRCWLTQVSARHTDGGGGLSQSNGPLYNNTVIGTLAVDGWAVTFGTMRRGLGGAPARPDPSSLYQM